MTMMISKRLINKAFKYKFKNYFFISILLLKMNFKLIIIVLIERIYMTIVNSSVLSTLTDCQNPSEHYLKKQLELHEKNFGKKIDQYSNSDFKKYYNNLILDTDRRGHELIRDDTLIAYLEHNNVQKSKLKRLDRYPNEVDIYFCRFSFYFDQDHAKFLKCQNEYKLKPVLARGLCNVELMQWEWNFHFENRSISCFCF